MTRARRDCEENAGRSSRNSSLAHVVSRIAALGCLVITSPGHSAVSYAQTGTPEPVFHAVNPDDEVVRYPASFFAQYEPDSALDMVRQLPGFQIDDGADKRGFGAAAGNILINERRSSAKQDLPSEILRRIPASVVAHIELVRGQIPGLDVQGQSVLANVVLLEDAPAAIRWDASFRKHSNVTPLRGEGSISIADRWKDVDYSAGVSGFRASFGDEGTETVFDGEDRVSEQRLDDSLAINITGNSYLNASVWLGQTLLSLNTSVGYTNRDELLTSHRIPRNDGGVLRDEYFGDKTITRQFEFGLDAERSLFPELIGKGILLVHGSEQDNRNNQQVVPVDGVQTLFRVAESQRNRTEAISRLEIDWLKWPEHVAQADFELAYNTLDNNLDRIDDAGSGPMAVDVPGANTRVAEIRFDVLLQETWSPGDWSVNVGLGAERSTISQSGDAVQERRFFF